MAFTAAPRNSAVATATSSTIVFTVTATTPGDFGIVVISMLASAFGTWSPIPSGWTLVDQFNVSGLVTAIFTVNSFAQPGGTTSLSFTTSNSIAHMCGIYACWAQAARGLDGPQSTSGAATPLPTVSTSALAFNGDLGIWVGSQAATSAPGNPTGTGTWTPVPNGAAWRWLK